MHSVKSQCTAQKYQLLKKNVSLKSLKEEGNSSCFSVDAFCRKEGHDF